MERYNNEIVLENDSFIELSEECQLSIDGGCGTPVTTNVSASGVKCNNQTVGYGCITGGGTGNICAGGSGNICW